MDYKKIIEDRIKHLEDIEKRDYKAGIDIRGISLVIFELKDLLKKGVA